MIPIQRLHYKLDMKLNKLASNQQQSISPEDKDFALNEAQIKLIKKRTGEGSVQKVGMDGFRQCYEDLQFLVVEHEKLTPVKGNGAVSFYSADVNDLTHKYFLPIDAYTVCSRDRCKGRTVWVENIAKHSDVPLYLNSPDLCPSFAYQVTFAVVSSDRYLIYTEDPQGKFSVEELHLSYLRHPVSVCIGEYEDFDGQTLIKTDCEFPEHLEDELLEIAVMDLALSTENQFAAQAAQIRAQQGQ